MTLLTVVMPVYNSAARIDAALSNVVNRTHRDLEIIVLDNCSTDATCEIALKYADKDPRVTVVRREKNIGMWPNFADGLRHGKSDLFAFRADDDFSSLDYFERLVRLMEDNPSAVLAAGTVERLWPDGRRATIKADFRDRKKMILGASASWFYGVWKRDYFAQRFNSVTGTFPYVGGRDFIILYDALVSGRVVCDPGVTFTQHSPAGNRNYLTPNKLSPSEQWRFRSTFKAHCARDNARLPPSERFRYALMPTLFTEKRGRRFGSVIGSALKARR